MDKKTIIRKLTSRKLWMAVAGFVSLLLVALGRTEGEAAQITALIMAGASVIAYIVGEGLIDAGRTDGDEEADTQSTQAIGFVTDSEPVDEDDEYIPLTPDDPFY